MPFRAHRPEAAPPATSPSATSRDETSPDATSPTTTPAGRPRSPRAASSRAQRAGRDGRDGAEDLQGLPVVACRLYAGGGAHDVDDLPEALERARSGGGFLWIGLHGATAEHVHRLARTFDLPALAVEDAVNAHQRPKVERFPEVTFAVLKPVRYVDHDEVVDVAEIAVFVGRHFVITVRHGESDVVSAVRSVLEDAAQQSVPVHLPSPSPASVLHQLLDEVVDGYLDAVDGIAIDVEDIEEQVFSGGDEEHAERIYKLKREVLEFKRAVTPLVHPVQRLAEGGSPGDATLPEDKRHHYRDVLDHLLRAGEAIDGYDRLLTDVLQAHLAQVSVRQNRVSARQNEDMRRISAWAAIALVPTAIAGIYGMNFDNMPELSTRYGYFVVLAVIVVVCVSLYVAFRVRKWL